MIRQKVYSLIDDLRDACWRIDRQTIKLFRLNDGFRKGKTKKARIDYKAFVFYQGKLTGYLYVLDELGDKKFVKDMRKRRGFKVVDKKAGQFKEENLYQLAGLYK